MVPIVLRCNVFNPSDIQYFFCEQDGMNFPYDKSQSKFSRNFKFGRSNIVTQNPLRRKSPRRMVKSSRSRPDNLHKVNDRKQIYFSASPSMYMITRGRMDELGHLHPVGQCGLRSDIEYH